MAVVMREVAGATGAIRQCLRLLLSCSWPTSLPILIRPLFDPFDSRKQVHETRDNGLGALAAFGILLDKGRSSNPQDVCGHAHAVVFGLTRLQVRVPALLVTIFSSYAASPVGSIGGCAP